LSGSAAQRGVRLEGGSDGVKRQFRAL